MPFSSRWDAERELWEITSGESFSLDEVLEVIAQTDWGRTLRFLWDLRVLRSGPDATGELQQVAASTKEGGGLWSGGRAAIVVTRDFDFGIARMFQVFAGDAGVEYEVFRDYAAAVDWLMAHPSSRE